MGFPFFNGNLGNFVDCISKPNNYRTASCDIFRHGHDAGTWKGCHISMLGEAEGKIEPKAAEKIQIPAKAILHY